MGRSPTKKPKKKKIEAEIEIHCEHCEKLMEDKEKALFVEEERNRVFCSEPCILGHFQPEIARLEEEYEKRRRKDDLSSDELSKLSSLKTLTLKNPEEVWRVKTIQGDYRYSMIASFPYQGKKVWSICISLFLRGEPSFLYVAIVTKHSELVNTYRKGERVEFEPHLQETSNMEDNNEQIDCLADPWTDDELFRAQILQFRSEDDIPENEFTQYENCIEESLKIPDEVWSWKGKAARGLKVYHFLKNYSKTDVPLWYVTIAKETEDREQLEILEAFPTNDPLFVERFRHGEQEIGNTKAPSQSDVSATRYLH